MTTIKGLLIPADLDRPIETVEIDPDDYTVIQQYVGGLFQVLDIPREPFVSLFFHEEGKIEQLPLNGRATEFLYAHRNEFVGYDVLLGDVLILGPADDDGNSTSAPDSLIDRLVNSNVH